MTKKIILIVSLVLLTLPLTKTPARATSYGAGSLLARAGVEGAAVYYIAKDGNKYVFPELKTYNSWYDDFSAVIRVSVAVLDEYSDGGAMPFRAGTKLITHENTAKVYAVSPGGVLHAITDSEQAVSLYGTDWASRVVDVIPGFFATSYSVSSELANTYPDGSLLQVGDAKYYVEDGELRQFANDQAFAANSFSQNYIISVDDVSAYNLSNIIDSREDSFLPFAVVDTGPVVPTPEPEPEPEPVSETLPIISVNQFDGNDTIKINGITTHKFDLLKFSVENPTDSSIGFYKFTFLIEKVGVNLSNGKYILYESATAADHGDIIATTGDFVITVVGTSVTLNTFFDVDNDEIAGFGHDHKVLAPNETRYFRLEAEIANADRKKDNQSTVTSILLDDTAAASNKNAQQLEDLNNFIWSDLDFPDSYSGDPIFSEGWFNGSGIVDPALSQTVSD